MTAKLGAGRPAAIAGNRLDVLVEGKARRLAVGTRTLLARRLRRAMRAAGLSRAELSLTLSDDRRLHALNRGYADEDHATDVLSFAQAEATILAPEGGAARSPLGDIVISVEYAARQAKAGRRGLPGELFHLAVHGLVHLLGYDHRDQAEERTMFAYETKLRCSALRRGEVRRVVSPRSASRRRR